MKSKRILLFCFLVMGISLQAQINGYVGVRAGLNLREYADIDAKSLVIIPYGTAIEGASKESYGGYTSMGMKGDWRKVTYNGKTGFLFDGFLLPIPPPDSTAGTLDNYIDKFYKKVSGPETYTDAAGAIYTQTVYEKGIYIMSHQTGAVKATTYYLTGIPLDKAYLFCKQFISLNEVIGEKSAFPPDETDQSARTVRQLYSPYHNSKDLRGVFISSGDKTPFIFQIRQEEGRVEITIRN